MANHRGSRRKLKTETDTVAMAKRIERAFRKSSYPGHDKLFHVDFEHGQHWITVTHSGRQYSVVDASGYGTIDGFDFEVVSEGDEDEWY